MTTAKKIKILRAEIVKLERNERRGDLRGVSDEAYNILIDTLSRNRRVVAEWFSGDMDNHPRIVGCGFALAALREKNARND